MDHRHKEQPTEQDNNPHRHFSVTFFNTELSKTAIAQELIAQSATYVILGFEICPTTKRPHYQGYVEFKRRLRCKQLGAMFKHLLPCFLPRKASQKANIAYCSKDGDVYEYGTPWKAGKAGGEAQKNKWQDIHKLARQRKFGTIAEAYPSEYAHCHRGIQALSTAVDIPDIPSRTDTKVYWFYGETRTGKTTHARLNVLKGKEGTDWHLQSGGTFRWNRYQYQPQVLIDELAKYSDPADIAGLKGVLDVWSCVVPCKTDPDKVIRPEVVVITCQFPPEELFDDSRDLAAIKARCVQILHFKSRDNIIVVKGENALPCLPSTQQAQTNETPTTHTSEV